MFITLISYFTFLFLIKIGINGGTLNDRDFPTLIQQPAGTEVNLTCGIWSNHTEYMSLSDVYWDFKPCGEGYNQTSCRKKILNDSSTSWKRIICDHNNVPCKAILTIQNPMEKDSGLYRCNIAPYKPNDQTTFQIQIVKTFQLDVINFTIAAPELMDDLPANTTAMADSQVVLQCRVHSKVPPSIKWLRRQDNNVEFSLDEDNYNARIIQYFENTYELLESAGEKGLTEDTYLSKLILNNVSEKDSGFYVCVGINYRGFKIREAYLHVQYPELSKTNSSDFYLLFLIPVGLAGIPVILYCIYLIIKRINLRISERKQKRHCTSGNRIYEEISIRVK